MVLVVVRYAAYAPFAVKAAAFKGMWQALLSSYFTCVFCAREVEAQWRPQPSSYLATVSPRSALGSESSAWYPTWKAASRRDEGA
jgi:hypothetical protein